LKTASIVTLALAIIKPKIVRHTNHLVGQLSVSTDAANFSKWPACEPGFHKSFDSKFSFAAWYLPRDFFGVEPFDAFSYR
jgi:hypothetical protein